jgi:Dyp-type peroxidase family
VTDLTVVAPVKRGHVPGMTSYVSYADRLERVLRVLHSVRQLSREASLQASPFADSIGQFRGIHYFRFGIARFGGQAHFRGRPHLLLNVTFDGGWETYMRVIWKPLGAFLDLIFCHCEGYPMAFQTDYNQYIRWVREHEVESAFFYADSAATVADEQFLRRLESIQLESGTVPESDRRAAEFALPAQPPTAIPSGFGAITSLRVLTAVAKLRDLFPKAEDAYTQPPDEPVIPFDQADVLQRFARNLLVDLRRWICNDLFDPGHEFAALRSSLEPYHGWLMDPPVPVDHSRGNGNGHKVSNSDVQAGIHRPYPSLTVNGAREKVCKGVLALVRVVDTESARKAAREWLAKAANVTSADENSPPNDQIYRNIAITIQGLDLLGIPEPDRATLPRDFLEGMEERAGVLGDLRQNHPNSWKRPRRNWDQQNRQTCTPFGPPIALSAVHLILQFRTTQAVDPLTPVQYLNDRVFDVLFVQEMKLEPPRQGESHGREHFGFADGISQPTLDSAGSTRVYWNDQVKEGEIFRGYLNERGDDGVIREKTAKVEGALLFNGSFLVVRKLRQFPDRLDQIVSDAAGRLDPNGSPGAHLQLCEEITAKMLGRRTNGAPLVSQTGVALNDFDYRNDTRGEQCPFQSHIRRANPRERLPLTFPPRIVRRAMSYQGTDAQGASEKGLMFLAYNASIAEQFEVLQRWLAGGNSSGISSSRSDPLLGVPEVGKPRTFQFVHDSRVVRIDLGDKPLVSLEWGLYAFVPSITALQAIGNWKDSPPPAPPPPLTDDPADAANVDRRSEFDDRTERKTAWAGVRAAVRVAKGATFSIDNCKFIGDAAGVFKVLNDDGSNYSVSGYRERMRDIVGDFYLGLDNAGKNSGHELPVVASVNQVVKDLSEEDAFDAACAVGEVVLGARVATSLQLTRIAAADIDLDEYARQTLAELCTLWFGLPDGKVMLDDWQPGDESKHARCPGDLFTASRATFFPNPLDALKRLAKNREQLIKPAFEALIKGNTARGQGVLTRKILALPDVEPLDVAARATLVAGVMLGFPVPTYGSLLFVLRAWVESRKLWDLQQDLVKGNVWMRPDFKVAQALLRDTLLKTMRQGPSPYEVWRTEVKGHGSSGCPVVLGLASAMDDDGDDLLMFGGSTDPNNSLHTPHACPGYSMAMGVMLGAAAALLTAGALRPTPNPLVVNVAAL